MGDLSSATPSWVRGGHHWNLFPMPRRMDVMIAPISRASECEGLTQGHLSRKGQDLTREQGEVANREACS